MTYYKQSIATLLLIPAILLCVAKADATTIVMMSDEDLIVSSRAIVRGHIVGLESRYDEHHELIYTFATIRLQEVLKGPLTAQEIVLRQLGGRIGDAVQFVYDTPQFALGEEVLLYLNTSDDGALHVAHFSIGRFSVVRDSGTGKPWVERSPTPDQTVNPLREKNADITNRADLDGYRDKILSTLSARASRVAEFERLNAGRPLLAVPREFNLSRASHTVQPQFTLLGQGYRWFEVDFGMPIPYKLDSANSPTGTNAIPEFNNTLAAWSTIANVPLTLKNDGSSQVCGFVQDGVTTVSFGDCHRQLDDPINCTGILAATMIFANANESKIVNGHRFFRLTESDVVFNNNFECFLAISQNLSEVMTHEIGHSVGLGHSSENPQEPDLFLKQATMYFRAHGDGRGAALRPDDTAGAAFIYPPGVVPNPVILDFTPASGPVGTKVMVTGKNFLGTTSVQFNGAAAGFSNVTDTSLDAVVPQNATSGPIGVTTTTGNTISTKIFTVIVPPPTIISFTPTSGPVGTNVTITGTYFTGATQVAFSGRRTVFTVNSESSIVAVVPSGAATAPISVTTPGGTATSNGNFEVTAGNPPPPQPPTITGFSPPGGPVGTPVTISGTNFANIVSVRFSSVTSAFAVSSTTEIRTSVPENATTGLLSLVTSDGSTALSANPFTVTVPDNAPTITRFSPTNGQPGTSVTLTGTKFTGATTVEFNGLKAVFSVGDESTITTSVPSGATSGPIRVTTPQGSIASSANFTVNAAPVAPTIISVTPGSGRVGTVITINGNNFDGATVRFGTIAAVTSSNTGTQIQTTVPSIAPGTITLTITTQGGSASASFTVESEPPPTITGISPLKGRAGTVVTITGSNLNNSVVRFGNIEAAISSATATQIQAVVPVNAPKGKTTLTVITVGGTATTGFKVKGK